MTSKTLWLRHCITCTLIIVIYSKPEEYGIEATVGGSVEIAYCLPLHIDHIAPYKKQVGPLYDEYYNVIICILFMNYSHVPLHEPTLSTIEYLRLLRTSVRRYHHRHLMPTFVSFRQLGRHGHDGHHCQALQSRDQLVYLGRFYDVDDDTDAERTSRTAIVVSRKRIRELEPVGVCLFLIAII